MIDTIGCIAPISEDLFNYLQDNSLYTSRIDKRSGGIEFERSNLDTPMSYGYKVGFNLSDKKWIYDPTIKKTVKESGFHHLRLEFSAPKILYGHNLESIDFDKALETCMLVRQAFQRLYNCKIPQIAHWFCYRLDICANFILNDEQEVINYIRHLQNMEYPRRNAIIYKDETIFFPSRVNPFKIYVKGKEFKTHDMKKFLNRAEASSLHEFAKRIIRLEVELRGRLNYIFDEHVKKDMTNIEQLELAQWSGNMKLLDIKHYVDLKYEMERVKEMFMNGKETKFMESADVKKVLRSAYSIEQADSFYGVYMFIVTQGMKQARKEYSKNKLSRAKKAFRECGISFVSDVLRLANVNRGFPDDFTLELSPDNKYYQVPIAA
ncbi:MAG: phage/plasmid replication protein, II/X family [Nitrospirae bacterium]|nr:phage/plasmid replication protein, II/X family [Nitrospirota bacterium]